MVTTVRDIYQSYGGERAAFDAFFDGNMVKEELDLFSVMTSTASKLVWATERLNRRMASVESWVAKLQKEG